MGILLGILLGIHAVCFGSQLLDVNRTTRCRGTVRKAFLSRDQSKKRAHIEKGGIRRMLAADVSEMGGVMAAVIERESVTLSQPKAVQVGVVRHGE